MASPDRLQPNAVAGEAHGAESARAPQGSEASKMPLESGADKATIERNIQRLIREGYSPQQAAAIAHRRARESKAKRSK